MKRFDKPVDEIGSHFSEELLGIEREQSNRTNLAIARKALRRVIAERLTEKQRETLYLRYYEGLRPYEIAKRQGVHRSTVTRSLQRSLKLIRRDMQFYMDYSRINWRDDS